MARKPAPGRRPNANPTEVIETMRRCLGPFAPANQPGATGVTSRDFAYLLLHGYRPDTPDTTRVGAGLSLMLYIRDLTEEAAAVWKAMHAPMQRVAAFAEAKGIDSSRFLMSYGTCERAELFESFAFIQRVDLIQHGPDTDPEAADLDLSLQTVLRLAKELPRDNKDTLGVPAGTEAIDEHDAALLAFLNRNPGLRRKVSDVLPDKGPQDRKAIAKRLRKLADRTPPLVDYPKGKHGKVAILPAGIEMLKRATPSTPQ